MKPAYAIQYEADVPGFDYVQNSRQYLQDLLVRHQPKGPIVDSDTFMEAQIRLRKSGAWPEDRVYLGFPGVPYEHALDCAVEQGHMAIEWAGRASDVELLRAISYPTGGVVYHAAWAEAGKRGLV